MQRKGGPWDRSLGAIIADSQAPTKQAALGRAWVVKPHGLNDLVFGVHFGGINWGWPPGAAFPRTGLAQWVAKPLGVRSGLPETVETKVCPTGGGQCYEIIGVTTV
jgi:hypothetical protein